MWLYAQHVLYQICACSVHGCLGFKTFLNLCTCPGCLLTHNSQVWKSFNCNRMVLDQYTNLVKAHRSRGPAANATQSTGSTDSSSCQNHSIVSKTVMLKRIVHPRKIMSSFTTLILISFQTQLRFSFEFSCIGFSYNNSSQRPRQDIKQHNFYLSSAYYLCHLNSDERDFSLLMTQTMVLQIHKGHMGLLLFFLFFPFWSLTVVITVVVRKLLFLCSTEQN